MTFDLISENCKKLISSLEDSKFVDLDSNEYENLILILNQTKNSIQSFEKKINLIQVNSNRKISFDIDGCKIELNLDENEEELNNLQEDNQNEDDCRDKNKDIENNQFNEKIVFLNYLNLKINKLYDENLTNNLNDVEQNTNIYSKRNLSSDSTFSEEDIINYKKKKRVYSKIYSSDEEISDFPSTDTSICESTISSSTCISNYKSNHNKKKVLAVKPCLVKLVKLNPELIELALTNIEQAEKSIKNQNSNFLNENYSTLNNDSQSSDDEYQKFVKEDFMIFSELSFSSSGDESFYSKNKNDETIQIYKRKKLKKNNLTKKSLFLDNLNNSSESNSSSSNFSSFLSDFTDCYFSSDDENSLKISNKKKFYKKSNYFLNQNVLNSQSKEEKKKEIERIKILQCKNKKYEKLLNLYKKNNLNSSEIVLEFDYKTTEPLVTVDKNLSKNFKPHQINGIKFLYDNTIERIDFLKNEKPGFGCILAHNMGLGKTFQIISFIHTILNNKEIKKYINKILIIVPKNTCSNWADEFKKWIFKNINNNEFKIFKFWKLFSLQDKLDLINKWNKEGGVLIINYKMFCLQSLNYKNDFKSFNKIWKYSFFDPGPDLVILDEGHLIKNSNTIMNTLINKIKTKRRVILTGTPLQNNLKEYYVMCNFVRPYLLGDQKEFQNFFINPINKGQNQDANNYQLKLMKKCVYVLHKLLSNVVQRYDYKTLLPYLEKKYEYVLKIRLSNFQHELYQNFLNVSSRKFFLDYEIFKSIFNHPFILKVKKKNMDKLDFQFAIKQNYQNNLLNYFNQIDKDFFQSILDMDQNKIIEISSKMEILFSIINLSCLNKEKLIVFSQSLILLDIIEKCLDFYGKKNSESWIKDYDYLRIDGNDSIERRTVSIEKFNDKNDLRPRLFLLSTNACSLGINLIGATRCVIFDASWNPSIDTQAIYRLYRLGQNKPVYIYRFISYATVEEKIYNKQVWKQSLSQRVTDAKHTKRHFKETDLSKLYDYNPNFSSKSIPKLPKDNLLAEILKKHDNLIMSYHEHDSLLENELKDDLNEQEQRIAWEDYKQGKKFKISDKNNDLSQKKFNHKHNFINMKIESDDFFYNEKLRSNSFIQKNINLNSLDFFIFNQNKNISNNQEPEIIFQNVQQKFNQHQNVQQQNNQRKINQYNNNNNNNIQNQYNLQKNIEQQNTHKQTSQNIQMQVNSQYKIQQQTSQRQNIQKQDNQQNIIQEQKNNFQNTQQQSNQEQKSNVHQNNKIQKNEFCKSKHNFFQNKDYYFNQNLCSSKYYNQHENSNLSCLKVKHNQNIRFLEVNNSNTNFCIQNDKSNHKKKPNESESNFENNDVICLDQNDKILNSNLNTKDIYITDCFLSSNTEKKKLKDLISILNSCKELNFVNMVRLALRKKKKILTIYDLKDAFIESKKVLDEHHQIIVQNRTYLVKINHLHIFHEKAKLNLNQQFEYYEKLKNNYNLFVSAFPEYKYIMIRDGKHYLDKWIQETD